jgi:hypothetical protein
MKKMNSRRIIFAGTLLAGAMLFGGMAQGQVQTLVITENSSTSLTWDLNGVSHTITPGPDAWIIMSTALAGISSSGTNVFWQEPGETTVNYVNGSPLGSLGELNVFSDRVAIGVLVLPNGATDKTHFTLNGAELDVTFNDNGDSPSVPDTATTLPLLGLSLAALGFAKRRLF